MNRNLVLSLRSQYFHSLRHFSNQANERSTTQRLRITEKVCSCCAWWVHAADIASCLGRTTSTCFF